MKRFAQTCGKFKVNGKLILVVAGGYAHDTVEILDPLSDQGWIRGTILAKNVPRIPNCVNTNYLQVLNFRTK